ncbi:FAD-dependent oxidoreductase, partial [Pseudomonas aeruginosa]|uniref:FAD-dependent oxidoreductase n=1 Tax=Pseudomonas aeruginosa TaxID=287 RepID=UPI0035CCD6E4
MPWPSLFIVLPLSSAPIVEALENTWITIVMAQRVCIIGAGVVGLATAYALVREGFDVTLVEARERGGLETSYANGGQLSYRYVAPLADSGVPAQALGWLLRNDAPLRLRPRLDPAQW